MDSDDAQPRSEGGELSIGSEGSLDGARRPSSPDTASSDGSAGERNHNILRSGLMALGALQRDQWAVGPVRILSVLQCLELAAAHLYRASRLETPAPDGVGSVGLHESAVMPMLRDSLPHHLNRLLREDSQLDVDDEGLIIRCLEHLAFVAALFPSFLHLQGSLSTPESTSAVAADLQNSYFSFYLALDPLCPLHAQPPLSMCGVPRPARSNSAWVTPLDALPSYPYEVWPSFVAEAFASFKGFDLPVTLLLTQAPALDPFALHVLLLPLAHAGPLLQPLARQKVEQALQVVTDSVQARLDSAPGFQGFQERPGGGPPEGALAVLLPLLREAWDGVAGAAAAEAKVGPLERERLLRLLRSGSFTRPSWRSRAQ